jgi:amphi-Trp domain-containing protein
MGRETTLFKSKQRMNRADLSAFLHQLGDKISEGQILLRQGSDEVTLQLAEYLILDIKAEDEQKKKKGLEHTLEFEIKWFDDESISAPLELG